MRYGKPVKEAREDHTTDDVATYMREKLRRLEQRENELMWALARETDLTQAECGKVAVMSKSEAPGQSRVSKIVSEVDDRILERCYQLDQKNPDQEADETLTHFLRLSAGKLQSSPEPVKEEYKTYIAETIIRREALRRAMEPQTEVPEWAEKQLPGEIADNLTELRTEQYYNHDGKYLQEEDLARDIREQLAGQVVADD